MSFHAFLSAGDEPFLPSILYLCALVRLLYVYKPLKMKPSSTRPVRKTPSSKNRIVTITSENTLLPFLFETLKNESKTTVKALLAHKQIVVNGKPNTKFDTPLKPGDQVGIYFDRSHSVLSQSMLNILYEDDSIIVIDKTSGLLSMATDRDKEKTAYHILSDHVKKKNPRNCIFILHRLDRETSGIMMFAKSLKVQESLQKNWDQAITERKYVAVVEGQLQEPQGTVKSYLAENSTYLVHSTTANRGKLSITHYRVLKSKGQYSLVELELETGRKNQIRVHMQELGCPVAGDKKYGAKTNPIHRLALHAFKLRFIHPVTQKEMNFETPFPKRFELLVK